MARDRATRPEAKPLRLFVGAEIPSGARAALDSAIEPWRAAFPKARWAPIENWHVTLKFLGSTYPRLKDWVERSIEEVTADIAPFPSRLTGIGAFPSVERARVVWAGLDDKAGRMAGLALALDAALASEFRPETRPFRPHLTIARSDPPLALPESFEQTPLETALFSIDRIVLFRSHLRRPAPRYEAIGEFRLAG